MMCQPHSKNFIVGPGLQQFEAASKIPLSCINVDFLVDSEAAISSMCSNKASDNALVAKGRERLGELCHGGTTEKGVHGNERADAKASTNLWEQENLSTG